MLLIRTLQAFGVEQVCILKNLSCLCFTFWENNSSGGASAGAGVGGVWKSGDLEIWEFGDLGIGRSGDLEIQKFGDPGTWKSRNLGSRKSKKIKFSKIIQIRFAQNVGKVWTSREKILLAPFGAI